MAKDHSLAYGENTVNVWYGSVFVLFALTDDIVLFDVVEWLLLTVQPKINKIKE
jgi:hypothetical protein